MDLREYQRQAAATSQQTDAERAMLVALLGLAGETGTLLTEHKKWLRDGEAHDRMTGVAEDIGDILWYLAAAASALGLDLADVAMANLQKVKARWPVGEARTGDPTFVNLPPAVQRDAGFAQGEQLPRYMEVALAPLPTDASRVVGIIEGKRPLGNLVGDNAYEDDGYRWHDAIHLAHSAVLGWSPVVRAVLKLKRKSDEQIDDVEDGGRAIAIEEGLAAAVFAYAADHRWLEGVRTIDSSLLSSVRTLTRGLEVRDVTPLEWEQTVLRAFFCWRQLRDHNGGLVTLDLDNRTLDHRPLTPDERASHAEAAAAAIAAGLK
jgi:NTP pyrophosphatase (non-canonical NTP hydrolase)